MIQRESIIYVVDDDEAVRASLEFLLRANGYKVRSFEFAKAIFEIAPQMRFGCIISDVRMPEISGFDLLQYMRKSSPNVSVIVITGHGDIALAVNAMRNGAVDFLEKPIDDGLLLSAVRSALECEVDDERRLTELSSIRDKPSMLGARQVAVPRNIDPTTASVLQDGPAPAGATRRLLLVRKGPQQLVLQNESRSGSAIDVRAMAGGALAQAYEVGVGRDGTRTIVTEEIVGAKPSLQVRAFVRRYDRAGNVTGVASIPIDGMDAVPRDFITVTGDGVVRVLMPTEGGVNIRQIELTPPAGQGKKLNENELKGLGKGGRDISVETRLSGIGTRGRFRTADDPRFKIDAPTPSITRDQVVKNASAFLNVNWVMTRDNYARPGIENLCVPREAKFWMRPKRFTPDMIGKTIGPMPYRWGGDDTPESFKARLDWGALAGDICTCRDPALDYCLTPVSAGIDCSGLVSRAWGIDKRGTSGLLDVATQLGSIADLKPGDAFDWPGRHVRLFVATAPGANIGYTVIESSTRLDCEGACMRDYRPSQLNGYLIIRYRGISDARRG